MSETFAAHFANERPGARVDGHVPREVVMSVKDFAAIGAGENAAFGVVVVTSASGRTAVFIRLAFHVGYDAVQR